MDPDDGRPQEGPEDEGPMFAWLPPEDRLWRHPSEVGASSGGRARRRAGLHAPPRMRPWPVAVCAAAVGALVTFGVGMTTGTFRHTVVQPVSVPTPDTVSFAVSTAASSGQADWPAVDKALAPSIVDIKVAAPTGAALFSGVLYAASRTRSYILTAGDVTSGGGRTTVTFASGQSERAHLVGDDSTSDVALLWVAGSHGDFPMYGSVSSLQLAEPVLDIGGAAGGRTLVDNGTVTGLDQQVDAEGGETFDGMMAVSGITISSAADGGALVDAAGAVIGIDTDLTSVEPADQGVAYAVPIDVAEHVAEELLEGRRPSHPWLGIDDATYVATSLAQQLGVSGGAEVAKVAPGSPAAADGLRAGDVVTDFGGHAVASPGALVMLLSQCQPGQRTTITYVAGGQLPHQVTITVGAEPAAG